MIAAALHIGQQVRHRDHKGQRVTGTVRSIGIEDNAVMVTIGLDAPIVIPARGDLDKELRLYTQHVPAHELSPFDSRDEALAALIDIARRTEALLAAQKWLDTGPDPEAMLLRDARSAIALAAGPSS